MFNYYVHNTGTIKGLQVSQILEDGTEVIRKSIKAPDITYGAFGNLSKEGYHKVSRADAGHILHFMDKALTCDSIEQAIMAKPYVPVKAEDGVEYPVELFFNQIVF